MLLFGQERSKENAALAAEPRCDSDSTRNGFHLRHRHCVSGRVSGSHNHPVRRGGRRSFPCSTRPPSALLPSCGSLTYTYAATCFISRILVSTFTPMAQTNPSSSRPRAVTICVCSFLVPAVFGSARATDAGPSKRFPSLLRSARPGASTDIRPTKGGTDRLRRLRR
jgi:hypothetical protein